MTTVTLDLKGLSCPLPVLRTNRAARELIPGDILRIDATDANAPEDLRLFCETTGHEFLDCVEDEGVYTISIRKPPAHLL